MKYTKGVHHLFREDKCRHQRRVTLTQAEHARLKRAADELGISITEAARRALSSQYGILFRQREKTSPFGYLKPDAVPGVTILFTDIELRQLAAVAERDGMSQVQVMRTAISKQYRIQMEHRQRDISADKIAA